MAQTCDVAERAAVGCDSRPRECFMYSDEADCGAAEHEAPESRPVELSVLCVQDWAPPATEPEHAGNESWRSVRAGDC